MNTKIHSIITLSILAFALIATGIPATFETVYAQGEDGNIGATTGDEGLTTESGNTTEGTSEETTGGDNGETTDEE